MSTDDITPTDSPAITDPTFLDEEAVKPVSNNLLDLLGGEKPDKKDNRVSLVTPPSSRPRGRPPKQQYLTPEEERERQRQLKKKKAEQYEKFIVEEVNNNILTVLIGLGVPEQVLFLPGKAPKATVVDPSYTEIANALTLKPQQARALASFTVELEGTNLGKSVVGATTNGNTALVLKGLSAAIAGSTYLFGVNKTVQRLMPFIKAMRQKGQTGDTTPDETGTDEPR